MLEEYATTNNIKYDLVIRARPDTMFLEGISSRDLKKITKDPNLVFYADYVINPEIQVSDKFAFGSQEAMKTYCSLWEYIEDYWKNPFGDGQKSSYRVGERLMKFHTKNQKEVRFQIFYIDMYTLRCSGKKMHYKKLGKIEKFTKKLNYRFCN